MRRDDLLALDEAKLAELRTIQEAQLETLSKKGFRSDYENKARLDLDGDSSDHLYRELIEELDEPATAEPTAAGNSVALADPIIID